MDTKDTVLIIGAGASKPYGFPTGKELLEEIKKILLPRNEFHSILESAHISPLEISGLLKYLEATKAGTIDQFLAMPVGKNKNYVKLLKCAISYILLKQENLSQSFSVDDWYTKLYNKLFGYTENGSPNNIAIITFNYERSLEEHLLAMHVSRNAISREVAMKSSVWDASPIVHVHGKLKSVAYGEGHTDFMSILKASEGIVVTTDDKLAQKESEEFKNAKYYVNGAKKIYVLGFGYDEENMEKIGLSSRTVYTSKKISGTATAKRPRERISITKKIPGIRLSNSTVNLFLQDIWT